MSRKPLYDRDEAASLQRREMFFTRENNAKFALLQEHIASCQRLVDIGCGWGQLLCMAQERVPEVWGVDESPDRVKDVERVCPKARVVVCRADKLELPDRYFDVAVTSQMLHEVKLFGAAGELEAVLQEIARILAPGGKYLLLDHLDAGEGDVVVQFPEDRMARLLEFESKYQYSPASHEEFGHGRIKLSKRCLQDYLTKDWSLNSPMESMEMRETHNVFERAETIRLVEACGLTVRDWIPFADIREEMARAQTELVEGEGWFRKFLLVTTKP